jgi:hypothetical protein
MYNTILVGFLVNDHFHRVVTNGQVLFLGFLFPPIFYKLKRQNTYFHEILNFFSYPFREIFYTSSS